MNSIAVLIGCFFLVEASGNLLVESTFKNSSIDGLTSSVTSETFYGTNVTSTTNQASTSEINTFGDTSEMSISTAVEEITNSVTYTDISDTPVTTRYDIASMNTNSTSVTTFGQATDTPIARTAATVEMLLNNMATSTKMSPTTKNGLTSLTTSADSIKAMFSNAFLLFLATPVLFLLALASQEFGRLLYMINSYYSKRFVNSLLESFT